jgi:hypothetical protein
MQYLIAFGLLSLGAIIGFLISALFTGNKLFELAEQISFQTARADELGKKLRRLEDWTNPIILNLSPLFGSLGGRKK